MAMEVILSNLGVDITEATITSFVKKEGDQVKRGDIIALVETQKVSFEIVSPADGFLLKVLYKEGDVAKAGEAVAIVGEENEDISSLIRSISDQSLFNEKRKKTSISSDHLKKNHKSKAYPIARKLANQMEIDIYEIKGSGPGGIITKIDVENYAKKYKILEKELPLTGVRGTIAKNMIESLRTAAHVTTVIEVDMTAITDLREKAKAENSVKLSYLAYIIKAVVKSIKDVPIVNSIIKENKIILKKEINIGIAVGTEDALLVPVMCNVDQMKIEEISQKIGYLSTIIKNKQLSVQDLQGGTITLSNGGVFGPILNTPIINQPQVALIWTGRITKKPAVVENKIDIRDMMYICLSYDHRAMDGRDAGTFIYKIKQYLEAAELNYE